MQLASSPAMGLQLGDWAALSPTFKAVSVLHLHSLFQLHPNAKIMHFSRSTNILLCIWKTMAKTHLWLVACWLVTRVTRVRVLN